MIKACIFDLDGTLINSLPALNKVMNLALAENGLASITVEDTKRFVGSGYKNYVKNALSYLGNGSMDRLEEVCLSYVKFFREHSTDGIFAYDGIEELLLALKKRGILIAVLSNKSDAGTKANLHKVFGEHVFDKAYGEREGIPLKPSPIALLSLIKELEVEKDEVLYIGDTEVDMETGNSAGVKTIAVTWGFRDIDTFHGYAIAGLADKASDILKYIKE